MQKFLKILKKVAEIIIYVLTGIGVDQIFIN